MANWTMRVPDSLLAKAKIAAASQDIELSEFTRNSWRKIIRSSERARKAQIEPVEEVKNGNGTRRTTSKTTDLEPKHNPSSVGKDFAVQLSGKIRENNPNCKPFTEKQLSDWAHVADLMMARDGRLAPDIEAVIEWCQSDSFWKSNILSMGKLREKFDQLTLKMKNPIANKSYKSAPVLSAPVRSEMTEEQWAEWQAQEDLRCKQMGLL
jgi:hypothetical protein